jgi:microcin C transport system substrate-binding protein
MYPRFWEHFYSGNAYDDAFLDDGSVNPDRKIKTQTNNLETFAIAEVDPMILQYRESSDKQEMIEISHQLMEIFHENASFVPGFYQGFYRIGHWRWLRYPEYFNHKHSSSAGNLFVHWLDPGMKEQTLEARKSGETFPPQINIFDQWKD